MTDDHRWGIEYLPRAARTLRKLDRPVAARLLREIERLADVDDPATRCKPLTGPLTGLWRLRVGDYRIVLDIRGAELVLIAVDIGHRSRIYD